MAKPSEPKKPAAKKAAPAQSQSDIAKKLLEKVQAQAKSGPPGAGGKKGFDPKQLKGGGKSFGGGGNQMIRRTQSRGGGGGGGGGGSAA